MAGRERGLQRLAAPLGLEQHWAPLLLCAPSPRGRCFLHRHLGHSHASRRVPKLSTSVNQLPYKSPGLEIMERVIFEPLAHPWPQPVAHSLRLTLRASRPLLPPVPPRGEGQHEPWGCYTTRRRRSPGDSVGRKDTRTKKCTQCSVFICKMGAGWAEGVLGSTNPSLAHLPAAVVTPGPGSHVGGQPPCLTPLPGGSWWPLDRPQPTSRCRRWPAGTCSTGLGEQRGARRPTVGDSTAAPGHPSDTKKGVSPGGPGTCLR